MTVEIAGLQAEESPVIVLLPGLGSPSPELDCPRCHEPGGIEAFVKDGILAEDGVCDNCGYILPEGTELEEVE